MASRRTSAEVSDSITNNLIAQLDEAKAEKQAWTSEVERLEAKLLERLREKTSIVDGDELVTATPVRGETMHLDEGKLRRKLGAPLWAKVTERVLSRKKLEAAMELGEVPAEVVAECTEFTPKKAYVLIKRTKRKAGAPRRLT